METIGALKRKQAETKRGKAETKWKLERKLKLNKAEKVGKRWGRCGEGSGEKVGN